MDKNKEDAEWVSVPVSKKQAKFVLTLLFTAVLGGVGYPFISMVAPARHDPYTGQQGAKLEARVDKLEWELTAIRLGLADAVKHGKESEEWKRRIILLEERVK